jgi:large subunit ribosomal protein L19e
MNLKKKKNLAAKTLNVGKARIAFVKSRLDEIKEAITKQDIRDLYGEGAIIIKDIKGRRKIVRNTRKKGPGSIRLKKNVRKKEYITLTRKLRSYIQDLREQRKLSEEQFKEMRKKIRNRFFRSKSHLDEYLKALK